MFSSSFVISAIRVEDTGTTRCSDMMIEYSSFAIRVLISSMPPMTFGVLRIEKSRLPGSTRSGENTRKKSLPHFRPPLSRIGSTTSSVVPGYVVLSSMMSCLFLRCFNIVFAASTTYDRSGSLNFEKGVGTQMKITSAFSSSEKSAEAFR